MKVFSTTGRDSALECNRVNEIIARQFKQWRYFSLQEVEIV